MGLDFLCYWIYDMRVHVQRILVLLLILVGFSSPARAHHPTPSNLPDASFYWQDSRFRYDDSDLGPITATKDQKLGQCNWAYNNTCYGSVVLHSGTYYGAVWRYPENYQCPTGQVLGPDGVCVAAPDTADSCREKGQFWNSPTSSCVAECPDGSLDHFCMNNPPNECTADSADYLGTFGPAGFEQNPVCSGAASCPAGSVYGVINESGSLDGGDAKCISKDYGPPTCDSGMNLVLDPAGWVCYNPDNKPVADNKTDSDNDGIPDSMDSDSDGDGIPDAQDDDVNGDGVPNVSDPTFKGTKFDTSSIDEGLEGVNSNITAGNKTLEGIRAEMRKQNKYLDGIDHNLEEMTKTDNMPKDRLDGAPSFAETAVRLQEVIFTHPTIATLTTIPTIATSSSCPIWTVPATKFWEPIQWDIHCTILEQQRALLQTIFMALWSLAAIMVFLRA